MQGARFDPKPSQVGEKDKKEENIGKKMWSEWDLNPGPSDYRSYT